MTLIDARSSPGPAWGHRHGAEIKPFDNPNQYEGYYVGEDKALVFELENGKVFRITACNYPIFDFSMMDGP